MTTTPEDIARSVTDLVSIPEICTRLMEVINDEHRSLDDVAELIQNDPALTAHILRLANSPFYGQGGRIDTLPKAMMLTGTQAVVSLVLATCSVQTLSRLPQGRIDLHAFWHHAVAVAAIARALSARHRQTPPDRAFLAGLLHDVGLLALAVAAPEMATLLEVKRTNWPGPSYRLEESWMGYHHGHVGAALLRRWGFPECITVAVANHHEPRAEDGHHLLQLTVQAADAIAHRDDEGPVKNKETLPWPDAALEALGLDREVVDEVQADVRQYMDQLARMIMQPARAA